jgi:FtsP/CotA-like multicopper oxidase with cupredoxin domain
MKVIGTDFVSIEPYETSSLSVGIGQRYTVIIEAKPDTESSNGKYFLRTEYNTTNGCNQELTGAGITTGMDQTGIIYYGDDSDALPETTRHDLPVGCADEPYEKLKPIVPWTVSEPQNNVADDTFEAGLDTQNANKWHGAVFRWSITDTPLWLNFSDPLVLNLDNQTFNPEYAVVGENFKDGEKYVYLVIQAGNLQTNPGPVTKFGAAHHPIHLHGHDFAVIGQSTQPWDPANPGFKLDNPPRRDVAMLPATGHLAIAFKTDNPGAWILHCHIAWHAGSGLALNILERQEDIVIKEKEKVEQGCNGWNTWLAGHKDVFDPLEDQEDSGI